VKSYVNHLWRLLFRLDDRELAITVDETEVEVDELGEFVLEELVESEKMIV